MVVPAGCLSHATLPPDSTWSTPAAFPFSIPSLHQQLPLPSRVTSSIAQIVRAFLITPTAFRLHCLPSSALFPFIQMSNMTINLCTYLFPHIHWIWREQDNLFIIVYIAQVFCWRTTQCIFVEWMDYCTLSQDTRHRHLHIAR